MESARNRLNEDYGAFFKKYLAAPDENILHEAYEIGHRALAQKISLMDILSAHDDAIKDFLARKKSSEECARFIQMGKTFLTEALSPFDMAERGYLDAIDALKRQALELKRSNDELQSFASVVSHDLQEPLRTIGIFGDFIKRRVAAKLDKEALHYLERMQDSSSRMSKMIQDLLSYAKIAGAAALLKPVPLEDIVKEVLSDLEELIREAKADVLAEGLPMVTANPAQMRQLFQNLIGNALKFRKKEEPTRVTIRFLGSRDGMGEFSISDNGIGFDQRFAERVFEPFQRLHTREEFEGNGIGLAICRKIALRHGGDIRAESHPGVGTTFFFTLPLIRSPK